MLRGDGTDHQSVRPLAGGRRAGRLQSLLAPGAAPLGLLLAPALGLGPHLLRRAARRRQGPLQGPPRPRQPLAGDPAPPADARPALRRGGSPAQSRPGHPPGRSLIRRPEDAPPTEKRADSPKAACSPFLPTSAYQPRLPWASVQLPSVSPSRTACSRRITPICDS